MAGRRGPEDIAREQIDASLDAAGWAVQDRDGTDLSVQRGVAIREVKLERGHGYPDYFLFVDEKPVGVLEAKPAGHTLSGVEPQAAKYSTGLPEHLRRAAPILPLPFLYRSNGVETLIANLLDPQPRSRQLFAIHQPATLAEWLVAEPLGRWCSGWSPAQHAAEEPPAGTPYSPKPSTLRSRLQAMPEIAVPGLWPNKIVALTRLEQSLREDRPRALIQMATGSGKTMLAVTALYRLIKFAGARRVLFLVDRSNLGEQAEKEFQGYRTPDDRRKFRELYNVQRLTSNAIASSSKVVITTIQRMYSILRGEPELPPEAEEGSLFESAPPVTQPMPVVYNRALPPEYFDVIVVDECHRSIYTLWRQVLEYFDAFIIGLTATPAKHTFGFFHRNLVMEYSHDQAVADNVNVDFEVYRIRTKITEQGATIAANPEHVIGIRDRRTRQLRWETPDDPVSYKAEDLDDDVVARDQIRLIIRTYKERLFSEIFPGRKEVPKTLIFAKDDSHAEDVVAVVREEFGRGNDFCQKITYRTTGRKPADLIQEFRTSFNPRVVVTVDMIATGTDIKPVEVVMFMRTVKSRVLFEQMKGRGVRVISTDDFRAVTPDARAKTHFVIVDCVGVTESCKGETAPTERHRTISFKNLMERVAQGDTAPDTLSSLVSRLARLEKQFTPEDRKRVKEAAGVAIGDITHAIVQTLDPDHQLDETRRALSLPPDAQPTEEQLAATYQRLAKEAVKVIATKPAVRKLLEELRLRFEQVIDDISTDELIAERTGFSAEAKERAKLLVASFETYLEQHKEELDALHFFYTQPYARRLRYKDIKDLAEAIKAPPRSWTPELLWRAYETLQRDRVRGASGQRLLTDIVSLVRYALRRDDQLVPFTERVSERFANWMAQQQNAGRVFTPQQQEWLEMIRDHVATSLEIGIDDFDLTPFVERGGLGKAKQVFGNELGDLLAELNGALAA